MTTIEKLAALAADYEEKARGLRLAIAALNGADTGRAQKRFSTTLKAATQLRKKGQPKASMRAAAQMILREHGGYLPHAAFLAALKKQGFGGKGVGSLVLHQYVKKTAKDYTIGTNDARDG